MGRSRSATMVIMYLMRKFDISMSMSLDIAKLRREIVDPNVGFLQKLHDFEKKMKKKSLELFCLSAKIPEYKREFSSSSSSSEDLMEKQRSLNI